jgi:hypothetical protein
MLWIGRGGLNCIAQADDALELAVQALGRFRGNRAFRLRSS